MTKPIAIDNCAVLERTADGVAVGRCYYHTTGGICPRHGNVKSVQIRYAATGVLTDERDLLKGQGRAKIDDSVTQELAKTLERTNPWYTRLLNWLGL